MPTPDRTRALTEMIERSGLGPATVEILPGPPEVAKVELDATSPHKARTLLRWLDFIDVQDMVAGKFRASDPQVRLNVRGRFPGGDWVIVVAAFDEQSEATRPEIINAAVRGGRQHPRTLLTLLAGIEARVHRGRASGSG